MVHEGGADYIEDAALKGDATQFARIHNFVMKGQCWTCPLG